MIVFALVTDAYGAGGGIAQYNRDLFAALAGVDCCESIEVLARYGRLVDAELPPKVHQLGIAGGRLVFLLRALWAVKQLPRIDVVFCGHLFMLPLALLLSRLSGAPVWLQLHGIEAWQRPGLLLRWAVARVQLVTAVSRHTRRLFLRWAHCAPHRVKVLPNTVAEEFTPGPVPSELQIRYGTQGKRVLLTVSRLAATEQYKGHDRVIEAMALMRHQQPDLLYLIAGDGDDKPRLAAIVNKLQLQHHVHFIGYVADAELPALYRLADVFVMPSSGEGFGIVFLQAMAAGIPVVAGKGDGSRDPLRDGVNGSLVEVDDTQSIARQINLALTAGKTAIDNAAVFHRKHFAALVGRLQLHLTTIGQRR